MSDAAIMTNAPAGFGLARARTNFWRVEVTTDYTTVAERWKALARAGKALAFQVEPWLAAWYATLGERPDLVPLAATVVDARDGRDVMAIPLVRRLRGRLSVVEFADCGLTDYNAPIIGPGAPRDAAGAAELMRVLKASLPDADFLSLQKMPREIDGAPNPFALLRGTRTSSLSSNILEVEGEWNDWHWGLERTFRKELERSWRVFTRTPDARFERVTDPVEAARVLADLKRLQRDRIRELGLPYVLDEPENDRFYDELVTRGIATGETILTALFAGKETVAALLGVGMRSHYSMVRLAAATGAWKNCSPGRLMIERTMMSLHAEGYRHFDFTIGDYDYKRRFGARNAPLCEVETALGLRGAPLEALRAAKAAIRSRPGLREALGKLRRARPAA